MTTEERLDGIDEKLDRLERHLLALRILFPLAAKGGSRPIKTVLDGIEACEASEEPTVCLWEVLESIHNELKRSKWYHW